LMEAFVSGSVRDNSGTTMRAWRPFAFWGRMVAWSAFYVLAAAFPIGFGLRELGRELEAALEQGVEVEESERGR